ncbi:MAG: hypothetical protein KC656_09150 [Myxococcales bacterium]|nr:hypothetical protein [Myxococcales bacterium]
MAFALGLPFTGAGPMNGDQAVYLDQAARLALTERWTHAAYVALHAGWGTSWRSDVLTLACGAATVGWITSQCGIYRGVVLGLALLPWLAFGEVDLPWFLLVVVGVLAGRRTGSIALAGAVALSPTAVAALPWVAARTGDRRWVGGLAMIGLLSVLSAGGWWVGRRGVLMADWSLAPLTVVIPGSLAALALGRRPTGRELLALLPLLAAPSDVPAGLVGVLAVVVATVHLSRPVAVGVVAGGVLALLGGRGLLATHARVTAETAALTALAEEVGTRDEVRGPWSWRVRLSLLATGEVDGFAREGEGARTIELPVTPPVPPPGGTRPGCSG